MKWLINLFKSLFCKPELIKVEKNDTNNKKEEEMPQATVNWALKITVRRKILNECDTIGDLYVSYPEEPQTFNFVCNTLEDKVRNPKGTPKENFNKIYGETAIPYGTYRVIISYSNAFKKYLPEILNVPLYEGIRIHTGNINSDTYGCILLGDSPKISQTQSWIYNSKKNFNKFMNILEPSLKKGIVVLEITDGE